MAHRLRLVLSAALALPVAATAQDTGGYPPVVTVYRETVKIGKDIAHTKWETSWSRALEAAKSPDPLVAMVATTGANEVWFMRSFNSLADFQKSNDAAEANAALRAIQEKYVPAEADFLQDGRQMILTLRADLSYPTGRKMSELRYLSVTRVLVRPGHAAEYVEARTAVKAAHEKAKLPDGYAIYQVVDGMPGGTYYLFAGRRSLAELDDAAKVHADAAYLAALGTDWTKRNAALVQAYETSTDTNLFQLSPEMTIAPKQWITDDPYWKPKAPPKKAP